jgi:hypothetical protein
MKVLVDEIQQAVAENEQLRDALAIKESERFSLRNKLCQLRKGYAHLEAEACLLAEENKRLRQVCGIDSAESDSDEFHANANLIAAAPDMYAVASNFEIHGPDDDGMVWLVLHGRKATGRAMVRIGHKSLICAQVALKLEADRAAALRKARGKE